jgi:hypothetical protein
VGRVVKATGREAERVGLILEVYTIGEALKTGNHGYRRIFPRPLLQKHPAGKHRGIKSKR